MYITGLICFDTFQSKFTFRPRRAIQMNLPVLIKTAQIWVDIFDYEACGSARTPPLPSLASEVLLSMTVQCGWQCKSFMKVLSEHQLTQPWLHSMGCGAGEKILVAYGCDCFDEQPTKVKIHAEAWGVRKLMSHALRSLRLAREPRDLWMQWAISLNNPKI